MTYTQTPYGIITKPILHVYKTGIVVSKLDSVLWALVCLSGRKAVFSFSQFWSTYLFWFSTHLKCNISLFYFGLSLSLSLLLPASWLIVVGTRCCSTRKVEWTWETLTARPTESRWTLRTPSQRIRPVSLSLMSHLRNKSKLYIYSCLVYILYVLYVLSILCILLLHFLSFFC